MTAELLRPGLSLDRLAEIEIPDDLLIEAIEAATTPEERAAVERIVQAQVRREEFSTPGRFADAIDPEWVSAAHLDLISETIAQAAEEPIRVIIEVPVRHGKSWLVSAKAPSWYLERHPNNRVISICHAQSLAEQWGRMNRDLIESNPDRFTIEVRQDSRKVTDWNLTHGGGMLSTGVRGPVTGRGGNLILGDDFIKDAEQAFSKAYQAKLRQWWQMVIRTRLEPYASIVILQARWAEMDIIGWLLEQALLDSLADQWTEIKLPAVAVEGDPLGREPGEALWPERYPKPELDKIKASVGPLAWGALYQQDPTDEAGGMFDPTLWNYCNPADVPPLAATVRRWDLASTDEDDGADPDYTAGVKLGVARDGRTYILDVRRFRSDPAETDRQLELTAKADGLVTPVRVEQEPGSSGKRDVANLTRKVFAGYDFKGLPSTGSKPVRARALASQQGAGNVTLVRGHWNTMFVEEARLFPNRGRHDDMIDAASHAYNDVAVGDAIGADVGSAESEWAGRDY